jgi:hypothetical protein
MIWIMPAKSSPKTIGNFILGNSSAINLAAKRAVRLVISLSEEKYVSAAIES